jgi:hypothetical protein
MRGSRKRARTERTGGVGLRGAVALAIALAAAASTIALGGCGDDEEGGPSGASSAGTAGGGHPGGRGSHDGPGGRGGHDGPGGRGGHDGPGGRGTQGGGAEGGGAEAGGGASSASEPSGGEPAPPPEGKPSGPAESGSRDPRQTARERAAARTVRKLVAALDAGAGARVCGLLAPGAIGDVKLPRQRGSCAGSMSASIGYRDPRGLPVWKGARLTAIRSIEIDGERAKVVATTATTFADRDELSVEDDVVYLVRRGGRWLVAKPSSTLYRAVGIADVPPSVLSPPR